jgi:hypothetical protein
VLGINHQVPVVHFIANKEVGAPPKFFQHFLFFFCRILFRVLTGNLRQKWPVARLAPETDT